jgi:hypothetical protein
MIFGFTGTQEGMTKAQEIGLRYLFREHFTGIADGGNGSNDFHFGDCIGADAQAFDIAVEFNFCTFAHPGPNNEKRAFKPATVVLDELPNLVRNRVIVDTCAMLIATPKESHEIVRSGTWATIRYAQRVRRQKYVILPDGALMGRGQRYVA